MNLEQLINKSKSSSFLLSEEASLMLQLSRVRHVETKESERVHLHDQYERWIEHCRSGDHTEHEECVAKCLEELLPNLKRFLHCKCDRYWYSADEYFGYSFIVERGSKELLGIVKTYDITKTPEEVWDRLWTPPGARLIGPNPSFNGTPGGAR
jgi:hypothetical protein